MTSPYGPEHSGSKRNDAAAAAPANEGHWQSVQPHYEGAMAVTSTSSAPGVTGTAGSPTPPATTGRPVIKRYAWPLLIAGLVVGIAGGGLAIREGVLPGQWFGIEDGRRNVSVVESIQRTEDVVLLSLGITGLDEENNGGREIFGVRIPGTSRRQFVEYSYRAQLGIHGKDVTIEETGEGAYTVHIPKFIFIGHSDEKFRVAVEDNGVLSWTTPDIDSGEQFAKIFGDTEKDKHVRDNRDILQAQAKEFYSGIIQAVEPEAKLTFEFQ